jgi:S-adenosylmethionine synthetase
MWCDRAEPAQAVAIQEACLRLNKPFYQKSAAYGHFGRNPRRHFFSWEKTDLVDQLKTAL